MALERADPRQECDRRLAALEQRANRAGLLDSRLSFVRLATFVVAAALAGRAAFDPDLGWRWFFVAALAFGAIVVWHGRVVAERTLAERGARHYRRIVQTHENRGNGRVRR